MIDISNCPYTGSLRKVDYEFCWKRFNQSVELNCWVTYYKQDGTPIPEESIPSFKKTLVANNSYVVDITTGKIVVGADPNNLGTNQMKQYDFMVALTLAYIPGTTINTPLSDDISSLSALNILDADSRQIFDTRISSTIVAD